MNAIEKHGKSIAVALCVAGCSPLALTVLAETDGWSGPEKSDLKSTDSTLAKEVSSNQIGIEEPAANPAVESETVLAAVTSKAVDQIEAAAIQAVELSNIETQTENEIPASAVTEGNTMIAEAEIPEQAVQPVELPVEEAVQNTVAALSPAEEAVEQVDLINPEEAPAPDVTLSKPDPEVFENFCMEPVLPVVEEPVIEEPVVEEPVYEEPVVEEPVYEEPVYEEPVVEEPVYEEPVYEEPVVEEPVYEEPVYEEPVVEEPVYEEPVYEEPVVEEPVYEEPVYEEPVVEEPVYEEPVYEEPVYEEPVYEEPVYEEPVYEEPVYEEPEYTAPADDYSALNAAIASSALDLVGVTDGLQCTEVVELALLNAGVPDAQCLWPDEYASTYGYYTDSPVAGNLIYYDNGGRGTDHIAVYIGDGMAVHGNYTDENGEARTVVASVYINGGEPQYIQVCR